MCEQQSQQQQRHGAICRSAARSLARSRLWHILYRDAVKLVNLRACRVAVFASHLATRPRWRSVSVTACAPKRCDILAISVILDCGGLGTARDVYVVYSSLSPWRHTRKQLHACCCTGRRLVWYVAGDVNLAADRTAVFSDQQPTGFCRPRKPTHNVFDKNSCCRSAV